MSSLGELRGVLGSTDLLSKEYGFLCTRINERSFMISYRTPEMDYLRRIKGIVPLFTQSQQGRSEFMLSQGYQCNTNCPRWNWNSFCRFYYQLLCRFNKYNDGHNPLIRSPKTKLPTYEFQIHFSADCSESIMKQIRFNSWSINYT